MGYELRPNNNSNMKYDLDITNCEITGNTVKYTLSDGSIMQYALDAEGDVRKGSGKSCDNIELTKYQISVFEALKSLDGNEQDFTKDDLKDLTESKIVELVNKQLNGESDCEAKGATITKKSISVMFWDYERKVKRYLKIEFKSKFSNNVAKFFRNLFSRSNKVEKTDRASRFQGAKVDTNIVVGNLEEHPIDITNVEDNTEAVEPILSKREIRKAERKARKEARRRSTEDRSKDFGFKGDIEPEYEYSIKKGETGLKIAQKLGMPLSCLMSANTGLDWNNLSVGQVITIPSRKTVENCTITDSTDVAFYTGFSENFINKLIKNEGFSSTPYWDVKRFSVGYGHSGRILGKYINDPNVPSDARVIMSRAHVENNMINITEADACHILAQDILDRIAEAEAYFGEAFSRAPKSLQAGIVDIIFNAGVEKSFEDDNTKFIKYNLDNGDYISAVKNLLLYEDNKKLYKRNAYRILIALEDFSKTERSEVLESPEIKKHFNKTYQYLNSRNLQAETDMLKTIYEETLLL